MEIVYNGISVFVNRINGKRNNSRRAHTQVLKTFNMLVVFYDDEINEKKIVDSKWWIFYQYDGLYYANGIEISQGNRNQMWDTSYDNAMYGLGIDYQFKPIFINKERI